MEMIELLRFEFNVSRIIILKSSKFAHRVEFCHKNAALDYLYKIRHLLLDVLYQNLIQSLTFPYANHLKVFLLDLQIYNFAQGKAIVLGLEDQNPFG